VLRFTRAVIAPSAGLARQDVQTIAETIGPDFRDIDRGLLERAIERFKKQDTLGAWTLCSSPGLIPAGNLQTGGLHQKTHVRRPRDTAIAERAVQEVSGG